MVSRWESSSSFSISARAARTVAHPCRTEIPAAAPWNRLTLFLHLLPTLTQRSLYPFSTMGKPKEASVSSGNSYGNGKGGEKRSVDQNVTDASAPKRPKLQERTDYSRWRLLDEAGRHTWHYLEDEEDVEEWPQSLADKYFLGLPLVCTPFYSMSLY